MTKQIVENKVFINGEIQDKAWLDRVGGALLLANVSKGDCIRFDPDNKGDSEELNGQFFTVDEVVKNVFSDGAGSFQVSFDIHLHSEDLDLSGLITRIGVFDDNKEVVQGLRADAKEMKALSGMDDYWIQEAICNLQGMYKLLKSIKKQHLASRKSAKQGEE
jgi:hypothetical protein